MPVAAPRGIPFWYVWASPIVGRMDSSISASDSPPLVTPPSGRPPRPPVGRRRRRAHPVFRYGLVLVALVLAVVAGQFAVHSYRTAPRDTRAMTERELRLNTLGANEQVYRMAPVFQRSALDYFRATRGLLVLTNRRLLFLGLEPRDLLASSDAPPTFEERDYPIDTLVRLRPGRTFFWIAKAVQIDTPQGTTAYGVPAESWSKAELLLSAMEARYQKLYAEGARQKQLRLRADAERKAAELEARRPQYYVVKRGDALSSIATEWNTTPENIRAWNKITGNTIKAGETLLVRPHS